MSATQGESPTEPAAVDLRPRWMSRERFIREVLAHQADAGLSDYLADLARETTDDLQWC
ncbi:hypothetical protein [Candidatus Poriferisodalis sp.]|uniref:hypothetical protein n=1 Tax=Candidatus Poriferisodalis sp. TaxID=3101277 RepID=UPI003B52D391